MWTGSSILPLASTSYEELEKDNQVVQGGQIEDILHSVEPEKEGIQNTRPLNEEKDV